MSEMEGKTIVANPLIVLREEFDDWAILFDPDSGKTFSLNPIGVLIWKQLDGHHSLGDIVRSIEEAADGVSSDVAAHTRTFVDNIIRLGLASYENPRD